MHERLIQWMGFVIPLIEAVAIAIVLWGSVEGLAKLLRRIGLRLRGQVSKLDLEDIRIAIGEKMVLGLSSFWWEILSRQSLSRVGNRWRCWPASSVSGR